MTHDVFKNRKLLIASMHQKDHVIAPLLEKIYGIRSFINTELNTDLLGTFSGEIERNDDPLTSARKKCLLGMEISGADLAIASEGSFGPHPSIFFIPAHEEIMILIDKKNNIEITAQLLSTDTNFSGTEVHLKDALLAFCEQVKFPSHGLIFKNTQHHFSEIDKGICSYNELNHLFDKYISKYGSVFVETDMRAMFNPTRMKNIELLTEKLIIKINTQCPNCKIPGFSVTERKAGLPCQLCDLPTQSTWKHISICKHCQYQETIEFPDGKEFEDPMYCDFCNP